jgi:hypothetical protein
MTKRYSIVVAASVGYIEGLKAFLNSFEYYHGRDIKIYLLSYGLPKKFLEQKRDINLKVIPLDLSQDVAWATKIERFKFASSLSGVVMMADADMFFCGSVYRYFDIAKLGYIVAGSNGSNILYNKKYSEKYGEEFLPFYNHKTITTVPLILDVGKHGDVWKGVYDHKKGLEVSADFNLLNLYMKKLDKLDFIMALPPQQVTNIHHFQLKPNTRVREEGEFLYTEDGLEVLMSHGLWWNEAYVDGLLSTMEKYCTDWGRKCLIGARESRNILKRKFEEWRSKDDR